MNKDIQIDLLDYTEIDLIEDWYYLFGRSMNIPCNISYGLLKEKCEIKHNIYLNLDNDYRFNTKNFLNVTVVKTRNNANTATFFTFPCTKEKIVNFISRMERLKLIL